MIERFVQSIRQRWQALAARDQRALVLGGGVMVALLLGSLVWSRVETQQLRAERLTDKARQLAELSQRFSTGSAPTARPNDPARVATLIEQALAGLGADQPLVPVGAGQWAVELENVPLRQVIELERRLSAQGISVTRYTLERASAAGSVNGRLEWRTDPS